MKPAKKAAICGILTALSLVFMFLTGLFPIASYAIPAFCGILLMIVVFEMGRRQAMLVYLAVALLSLLLTPDREAAFIYIIFLGYYPVLKSKIEQLHNRWGILAIKVILFLAVLTIGFCASVFLLGLYEIHFGWLILLIGACVMTVVFLIYDTAVGLIAQMYCNQIRPKYLKRFFH